jgi:hypothetical protein
VLDAAAPVQRTELAFVAERDASATRCRRVQPRFRRALDDVGASDSTVELVG